MILLLFKVFYILDLNMNALDALSTIPLCQLGAEQCKCSLKGPFQMDCATKLRF